MRLRGRLSAHGRDRPDAPPRPRADRGRLPDDEPGFLRDPKYPGTGPVAQISCGRYIPGRWTEAITYRPLASLQVSCDRGIAFVDLPATVVWFDEAGRHQESLESERPVGEQLLTQFYRGVTSLVRKTSDLEDAYPRCGSSSRPAAATPKDAGFHFSASFIAVLGELESEVETGLPVSASNGKQDSRGVAGEIVASGHPKGDVIRLGCSGIDEVWRKLLRASAPWRETF